MFERRSVYMIINVCLKMLYLIQLKCFLKMFLKTEFLVAPATFLRVKYAVLGVGFSFKWIIFSLRFH